MYTRASQEPVAYTRQLLGTTAYDATYFVAMAYQGTLPHKLAGYCNVGIILNQKLSREKITKIVFWHQLKVG